MEIFWETLCEFIESKAKNVSENGERMLLHSDLNVDADYYETLTIAQSKFRIRKSNKWWKFYERILCKGWLMFVFLIGIAVGSSIALYKSFWWVGLPGLLSVIFIIYYYQTNRETYAGDYIYTMELNLRLWLMKIPPYDYDMANPRCIFIRWNEHEASTWDELVANNILPKLQKDLGIRYFNGLYGMLKNTEDSLNNFRKYSLWKDGLDGPLENVPRWCFWLLGFLCLAGITYYESIISKVGSFSTGLVILLYKKFKSSEENVKPDVEANQRLFDVMCRVNRMITGESIFITLVTNSSDFDILNKIPPEYRKYFKFLINIVDVSHLSSKEFDEYDHVYYINDFAKRWNQLMEESNMSKVNLLKLAVQSVNEHKLDPYHSKQSFRLKNTLDFLALLTRKSDYNNNALSGDEILFLLFDEVLIFRLRDGVVQIDYRICDTWFEVKQSQDFRSFMNAEKLGTHKIRFLSNYDLVICG